MVTKVELVKTVEYFKCDCEVGSLEEISKTKIREPVFKEEGWSPRESSQTIFYKCDNEKCNEVYKRDVTTPINKDQMGIEAIMSRIPIDKIEIPVPKDNIEAYKGLLNEHEILHAVPIFTGLIYPHEEDAIVKIRSQK